MTNDSLELTITYEEADVVSAQRLRYRHSPRLKLVAGLGIVVLLLPLLLPLFGSAAAGTDWTLLGGLAAVFLLVPALTYLLGPFLDFRRKASWHTPLNLRLSPTGLNLAMAGAAADQPAIDLSWSHLHHVLENEDALIFFFGEEQAFIIVPRRLLTEPQESLLSDWLAAATARLPEQDDQAGV